MDTSFIHADIFFVITSIAVILLTVILLIFLIYGLMILKEIRALVHVIHREAELVSSDLAEFRQKIQTGGTIAWLLHKFANRKRARRRREEDDEE